jgi:serine/threonine-protein kinase
MASLLNVLIGEYRVVELIGAGGMGEVYKAVHTHLGRVIAIKALSPDLADGLALERFYGEAGIQASLKHPGVAEYLGFYRYKGRPCILMEYVDGETLASLIRRRGPLPLPEAVGILRSIAAIAANFHAQGVVHRDLKANNVKITSAGQVKILDFGIARTEGSLRLTRTGAVIGTPETLAPEQVRGEPTTEATDIWQLGVLFYELLTGRLPFHATSEHEIYGRILTADFPPIAQSRPQFPSALEKIVARCLQKDPAKRFRSAAELCDALGAWEASLVPVPPAPKRPPSPLWGESLAAWQRAVAAVRSWLAASPAAAVVLGAMAVLLLVGVAAGVRWHGPHGQPGTDIQVNPPSPPPNGARTVTVDTVDGMAQVFQEGKLVGVTPFKIEAPPGQTIELLLRREGFKDLPLQLDAGERRRYTYTLERSGH